MLAYHPPLCSEIMMMMELLSLVMVGAAKLSNISDRSYEALVQSIANIGLSCSQ